MNKIYISGKVVDKPIMRMDGDSQHLILKLRVSHKKRSGERRAEEYRVNAWNRIAQWGASSIEPGQVVVIQGYLTQNAASDHAVEITAEEFHLMHSVVADQKPDLAQEESIASCKTE